ncbi:hypothetical protein GCM10011491_41590 [Brucella endophytica]|uniref:Uncharacterized protein n=1 Tax=Brucella endophytica TaxID=1963359 RepID=A0A916WLG1_9HYPH|nr:hypothetical protein [Brucella endophytica]GGB09295.1 hypothetical protein GCM10011491_41590 [Brucella endophytica]
MNLQPTIIALAIGLVGGSGATWVFTSPPVALPQNAEDAKVAHKIAALRSDPTLTLCSPSMGKQEPNTPVLQIPSADEAQAAFHVEKGATFPNVRISLGQCDKDTEGPGVACAVDIDWGDGTKGSGVVGFSKSPSGWKSTHYY